MIKCNRSHQMRTEGSQKCSSGVVDFGNISFAYLFYPVLILFMITVVHHLWVSPRTSSCERVTSVKAPFYVQVIAASEISCLCMEEAQPELDSFTLLNLGFSTLEVVHYFVRFTVFV